MNLTLYNMPVLAALSRLQSDSVDCIWPSKSHAPPNAPGPAPHTAVGRTAEAGLPGTEKGRPPASPDSSAHPTEAGGAHSDIRPEPLTTEGIVDMLEDAEKSARQKLGIGCSDLTLAYEDIRFVEMVRMFVSLKQEQQRQVFELRLAARQQYDHIQNIKRVQESKLR